MGAIAMKLGQHFLFFVIIGVALLITSGCKLEEKRDATTFRIFTSDDGKIGWRIIVFDKHKPSVESSRAGPKVDLKDVVTLIAGEPEFGYAKDTFVRVNSEDGATEAISPIRGKSGETFVKARGENVKYFAYFFGEESDLKDQPEVYELIHDFFDRANSENE